MCFIGDLFWFSITDGLGVYYVNSDSKRHATRQQFKRTGIYRMTSMESFI